MNKKTLNARNIKIVGQESIPKPTIDPNRRRGNNFVRYQDEHPSEHYDDFFEYEKEFAEFTPARNTVSSDIDQFTEKPRKKYVEPEPMQEPDNEIDEPSFVTMERLDNGDETQDEKFIYLRCHHIKDDGEQCKKQTRKDETLCNIHKKS